MATIFSMPKWGLAMKTGLVVEWLKREGDTVQQGEPIVEIESEKATNEVEAPISGVLRSVIVHEGESTGVSEPIAVLTAPGEELSDEQIAALLREEAELRRQKAEALTRPRAAAQASMGASTALKAPVQRGGRINASPAARRLAQEMGVDLAIVVGTGPGGMIGREDVLRAAEEAKGGAASEAQEQTVTVDGVATRYVIAGPTQAPRVVFVHGLGGSLATWSLNLPALAERYRICALDLVGAGDSAKPETDYSVPVLSAFLSHFLDVLGTDWQRVSLIGHSLGGALVLDFANRHPERVEKLVLVDSAGLGQEINGAVLDLMRSEPSPERIREELTHFFAHPGMVQQALVEQLYQQRIQPGAHAALIATSSAAFAHGRQQIDLHIQPKVSSERIMIVWGARDEVIPVGQGRATADAWHSRLEVFDESGHCPHIEEAERFNQLTLAFL